MTSLFFLLPKNALPRADLGSRCPLMRGVQGRLPISSPSINATKMELWIFFFNLEKDVFKNNFVYVWLASCREQGVLYDVVCGLLIAVASLVAEHRL